MSLSKRLRILGFLAIALAAAPWLAACTLTPVYSDNVAGQTELDLAYAAPSSRLDQVIYQELALRFGRSSAPTASLATVVTSVGTARLVDTVTANPNKSYEVTVTATLTIARRDGSDEAPLRLAILATLMR